MLHTIFSVISILLIILGLVEVAKMIVLLLLRSKGDETMMILVPIKGHDEEAEYLLRSAIARIKWFNFMKRQIIVCLDCGMDEETRKVCDLISKDYKFMKVCNIEDFQNILLNS